MPDVGAINAVGVLPMDVGHEFAASVNFNGSDTRLPIRIPVSSGTEAWPQGGTAAGHIVQRSVIAEPGEAMPGLTPRIQPTASPMFTLPPTHRPQFAAISTTSLKATLSRRAEKLTGRQCRFS